MTPNPSPFVNVPISPVPPASRFVKFGGYMVCSLCNMAEEFCACAKAPPPPTQGDGAESSLEQRVREVRANMQIRPAAPWSLHCGYCGRVLDRPGCACRDGR